MKYTARTLGTAVISLSVVLLAYCGSSKNSSPGHGTRPGSSHDTTKMSLKSDSTQTGSTHDTSSIKKVPAKPPVNPPKPKKNGKKEG